MNLEEQSEQPKPNPNPSKETIRRICTLFKCKKCWLLKTADLPIPLLVDIKSQGISQLEQELESWTGYSFEIYTTHSTQTMTDKFKLHGEKILPIDLDIPIRDIRKRSRI
jgi:hypothetical protein